MYRDEASIKGGTSVSITFITGGVRSGKSAFAEKLASECGERVLYVATGVNTDSSMEKRIQKHQVRRSANWGLIEEPFNLVKTLPLYESYDAILIDCLSTLVTNHLIHTTEENIPDENVERKLNEGLEHWLEGLEKMNKKVIVVSSEVGLGGVEMSRLGRWFQDVLGEVNQMAASRSDEAYTVFSGIPLRLKP